MKALEEIKKLLQNVGDVGELVEDCDGMVLTIWHVGRLVKAVEHYDAALSDLEHGKFLFRARAVRKQADKILEGRE